jgi:histidyl-tRNA synthetase
VLDLVTRTGPPAELLASLDDELRDVPGATDAITDMRVIFELLPAFGVAEHRFSLDLALARGLDYYTGPVFEATVTEPKVGSVGGAGRYDGLVGAFLGRPVAATGMSLGLERIIEVVREHNLLPAPTSVADVAVVVMKDTISEGARLAHVLRAAGLRADLSLQPQRGIGDQLKFADRRGIPLAVIVGFGELAENKATIKALASGDQVTLPLGEIPAAVKAQLSPAKVQG